MRQKNVYFLFFFTYYKNHPLFGCIAHTLYMISEADVARLFGFITS